MPIPSQTRRALLVGLCASLTLACSGVTTTTPKGGRKRKRGKGRDKPGRDTDAWPEMEVGEAGVFGELTAEDIRHRRVFFAPGAHPMPHTGHQVYLEGGKTYTLVITNLEDVQQGRKKGACLNADLYEEPPNGRSIEEMWDQDEVEYPGIGGGTQYWYDETHILAKQSGWHAVLVYSGEFDQDNRLRCADLARYHLRILEGAREKVGPYRP